MTHFVDERLPRAEHLPGREVRPEPRVEALRLLRTVYPLNPGVPHGLDFPAGRE